MKLAFAKMKPTSIAFLSASLLVSLATLGHANPTWTGGAAGDTTDWNNPANWTSLITPGVAPSTTSIAKFTTASPTHQPNVTSSADIEALYFSVGGYDITATNSATLTFGVGGNYYNTGDGNGYYLINALNTSGTNTINVPLLLTASTGKTQNFASDGGTLVIQGTIGDASGYTSTDTVEFYANGSTAIVDVTGANTFTNAVEIYGSGKTEVNTLGNSGSASALGENGTITMLAGSDLNYQGLGETSNKTFNLTANGTIDTTGATGTLNLSSAVTGTGYSLTKAGAGTLALSHAAGNTYSNGTTVSAGTLLVSNTSNSATGSGTVSLGAATLAGTGIISGQVHATGASGSSNITAATAATIGNLSLSGGVTSSTGLTLNLAIDGAGATNSTLTLGSTGLADSGGALIFNLYDLGSNSLIDNTPYTLIAGTGAISESSITANLLNSSYTLNRSYGSHGVLVSGDIATFEVTGGLAVPEPSTYALLGAGFLALIIFSRRYRFQGQ
jgi:hypothetical protein